MQALRQGDVLLRAIQIPTEAKHIPIRPVALGEKTGHHHSFLADPGICLEECVEMYEVETKGAITTFIRITGDGVSLVHQQHKAARMPVGDFVYVPQVENSDWGTRAIAD